MKAQKGKFKGTIYKFLAFLGVVIVVALFLQIPMVSDYVGKVAGVTGEKVRSVARTIASLGIGVALVTWGIASLAVPVLGGAMIVAGLALLAYSVWPLFAKKDTTFEQKDLFRIAN